jgi:hypothetical protein
MPSYNTGSDQPRSTPFYCGTTHPAQHFWAAIVESFENVTGLESVETFKTNREALHRPAFRSNQWGNTRRFDLKRRQSPGQQSQPRTAGMAESRLNRPRYHGNNLS